MRWRDVLDGLRRLPVIPTILVLVAVGVMLRLGVWQLDRRDDKAEMLSRYEAAAQSNAEVAWTTNEAEASDRLYARSSIVCEDVTDTSSIAGKNAAGKSGLAVVADCRLGSGETALVVLGWSQSPMVPDWQGGEVRGMIAPGPRLVADPPLAGLQANAIPDPAGLPDNHLAYAIQWFLFAVTALVIYALAVRTRLQK